MSTTPSTFISGLYQNVLRRTVAAGTATNAELLSWDSLISAGILTQAQATNAIVNSVEATTIVAPIIRIYQTFFNRVPDSAGLDFWVGRFRTGTSLATISSSFATATEFTTAYGTPSASTIDSFLTALYTNVLGRTADAAGFAFWKAQFAAQGSNAAAAATIANSFASSAEFTASSATNITNLLTTAASSGSLGTGPLGGTSGSSTGSTFNLTTGVDTLTGTASNDTFIADNTGAAATSGVADTINGGAGTDTLKIFAAKGTAVVLPTLTSIENLYLNNDGKGLDISSVSSITSLELDNRDMTSANTYTVNSQSVTLSNLATANTNKITIAGNTSTSQALVLSKYGNTAQGVVELTGTALTSVSIKSTGGANSIQLTNPTGIKVANITITGDQALTASIGAGAAAAGFAATGIASIDASAATAATTLTINGTNTTGQDNLAAAFSYKGGTANDSIDLTAAFVAGAAITPALINKMTFDGGAGTDTVILTNAAATTTTAITTFSNIEKIGVLNADGTPGPINMLNFGSSVTGLVFSGKFATAATTVNNLASTATVETGTTNFNSLALTINATGAGTSDALTMTVGSSTAASTNGAALTISGYETVNLTSQGAANSFAAVTIGASAGGSETVNLTLTKDLSVAAFTLSGSSTVINVSGAGALTATGVVTAGTFNDTGTGAVDFSGANNNILAFNAGTNNAVIKINDSGVSSAASITLGNGANVVTASGFNDVIKVGTGANTITPGAGADSVTFGTHTGVDAIIHQLGASGTYAAPGANTLSTSTFDVYTGMAKSDTIALNTTGGAAAANRYSAAANATATDSAIKPDGVAFTTLVGATPTANGTVFVRGTYTAATSTFVGSATGTDTLLAYDADAAAATTTLEAVVLVGYVQTTITGVGGANGVITLS